MSEYFVGTTGANSQTNFESLTTSQVLDDLSLNTGDSPSFSGLFINSTGTGANNTLFSVDGSNGRLFGVTDDVTGSIFSVNDAAGLPIIEVESTSSYDKITMGEYGSDLLVLSGQSTVEITGSQIASESWVGQQGYITSSIAANDATITIQGGTNITTSIGDFTTNQASAETLTINHATISRSDTTSSSTIAFGGTLSAINSITSSNGHVTAENTVSYTLPSLGTTSTTALAGNTTVNDVSETNLLNRLAALDSSDTIYIGDAGDDTTVVVRGTLQVDGSTTTINSNTLSIGDNQIVLNNDVTGTPTQNAGITVERGTATNASLIWDESNDYWKAGLAGSEVQLALTNGTYSGLRAQSTTKGDVGLGNVTNESKATMFASPSFTGDVVITDDTFPFIKSSTHGATIGIKFSDDQVGSYAQHGTLTFQHADGASYGSGASFILGTNQTSSTILADGKLMYGEGIYSKPASGTGAGTRKDSNWDTAYTHTSATNNPHSVTATQVGLGNVTNESKATMFSSAALTGNPTAPTPSTSDSDTSIATTAFVKAQNYLSSETYSTASALLTAIKTVDGSGSGLDADTLDGVSSGSFLRSDANDTVTGEITGSGDPSLSGFFLPQNPEGRHVKAPWFFNDMAYARLKGATVSVTVTGGSSPGTTDIDAMFDASTGFWNMPTSGVTEVVIEMTNLPKTMYHGSHMGATFGNPTWRPKDIKLESYYNGQYNELLDVGNQSKEYVTTSYNSGSNAQSKLRWTFSNFNSTSMRIVSLFAYNYNATGMPSLYLANNGGELYGDVTLKSPTGASQSSYALKLRKTNSSSAAQDGAEIVSGPYSTNTNGGDLILKTSNTSAVLTERMRINGAGNVGIGTNNPSNTLDIAGGLEVNAEAYIRSTNNVGLRIQTTDQGTTGNDGLRVGLNATHAFVWQYENLPLAFATNGSQKATILANGNFGIGTAAPSYKLDVNGDFRVVNAATFSAGTYFDQYLYHAGDTDTFIRFQTNDVNLTAAGQNLLRVDGNSSQKTVVVNEVGIDVDFRVEGSGEANALFVRGSDGNVGIGTTSPAVDLEIKTATNNSASVEGLRLYNAGGGIGSGVRIGLGVGSTYDEKGHIRTDIVSGGAGRLFLGSNGTDRLVINENGKVLVNGADDNSGKSDFAVSGGTVLAFRNNQIQMGGTDMNWSSKIFDDGQARWAAWDRNIEIFSTGSNTGSATARDIIFSPQTSGSAASTERMRIKGDGNVGIGTTSPNSILELASNNPVINFKDTTAGTDLSYRYIQNVDGKFLFAKANDAYNSFTTHMAIDTDGNVGIGTTSPSYKLEVDGTFSSNSLWTDASSVTYWGNGTSVYGILTWDTGYASVKAGPSKDLRLGGNNSSTHMAINTSGEVGIGTTSPNGLLEVRKDQTATTRLIISNGGTTNASTSARLSFYEGTAEKNYIERRKNGSGDFAFVSPADDNPFVFENATGEFMTLVNSKVGIGTTSPEVKLHVGTSTLGTAPDTNADIISSGGITIDDNRRLSFDTNYYIHGNIRYATSGTAEAKLEYQGYYGHNFITRSSSRMVISGNTGNVGIGQITPSEKLEVIGNIKQKQGSGYTNYVLSSVNEAQLTLSTYTGNQSNNPSAIIFSPNLSEAMRIDNAGNVGIGTTSPTGYQSSNETVLHIADSNVASLNLDSTATNGDCYVLSSTGSGDFRIFNDDTNTTVLNIDDAGNVGIGTTSPDYKLHVIGTASFTDTVAGAYFEENASNPELKELDTGTILTMDEEGEIVPSCKANDTMVFGASKRGYKQPIVMGAEPIKMTGPIKVGDFITTSSRYGHGMRSETKEVGTIIAQAMESGDGDSYNIKAMIRKM